MSASCASGESMSSLSIFFPVSASYSAMASDRSPSAMLTGQTARLAETRRGHFAAEK
ncbi:MAG: hypothetical protein IJG13_08540 [Kiritimatiellae bacterium]|nr:hypothetical protein [Kiritimatiellia bacterium]MBQ3342251.1 hypothetical protein [Kiritimatiellia bacterium]